MTGPEIGLGAGLAGRGVVVTGAAGGIGRATAELFARCGARVFAVDVDEQVETVVAGLEGEGHDGYVCDLADLGTHVRLLDRAEQSVGPVAALAHLAAVLRREPLDEVTEQGWDLQLDLNLKASFFLCRTAAEAMRARGAGSIVTFASQGWWTGGFGGSVVYSASKGGVVSMTRGLARTYGPDGVRVNAVAPGLVNTPMLHTGLDPDVHRRLVDDTPLRRVGEPEEVAAVVVFLAGDNASYVTGSVLNVSGGQLAY